MSDLTTKGAEIRAGLAGADEFDAPETMSPQDTARELVDRFRSGDCPFCGHDPYHYVDNGVGMERVAVTCCDLGIALFQDGDEQLSRASGERHEAANALSDLLALIEQQAAELAEARAERDDLRGAIYGSDFFDPAMSNAFFIDMVRTLEATCKAALARADELLREKERLGAFPLGWAEKARELYDRCKCWPEKTPDGIMALIELRNHAYAALSTPSALENGPAGLADAHSKSPAPTPSLSERIAVAVAAEREACAQAVEKRAVELGRQECCGVGITSGYSAPECCADPNFMISDREAAAAIRARAALSTAKERGDG